MQFDKQKLKAAILYTCSRCDPSRLGAVKLHKVLYFADMLRFLDRGTPLTGATYRKRPFGPTCVALLPMLSELESEHAIRIRDVEYFGYQKKEYVIQGSPDFSRLGTDELRLLDEVISFVCDGNTAKSISDFSHSTPWEIVEFGEVLPYHNALHLIPNQVTEDAFAWALTQVDAVEAERSNPKALDYPLLAALRSRVLQESRTE